jgi:hypothetical protein
MQRIRDARRDYRGPFSGIDVSKVLEEAGYQAVKVDDEGESFVVYQKDGRKPVPVNTEWDAIYDDDAIFKCLERDLGLSRSSLRTLLNEVGRKG